jgi:hypothetical protein
MPRPSPTRNIAAMRIIDPRLGEIERPGNVIFAIDG